MKSDHYLTLCLEQAALSPLHHRHGCIVVRGGKVIGQGFNDYRHVFDGGALKTGRLAARSVDGPSITELKQRRKNKQKLSVMPVDGSKNPESTKTFQAFEHVGLGGGHQVHTPLSMHSEMAAIHSALSSSSTLASSAVSSQKPYFKLSGGCKRKARLRSQAVEFYVEQVCKATLAQAAAQHCTEKANGNEWRFEAPASSSNQRDTESGQRIGRNENEKEYRYRCFNQSRHLPSKHVHGSGPDIIRSPFSGSGQEFQKGEKPAIRKAPLQGSQKQVQNKAVLGKTQAILRPVGRTRQSSHSPTDRIKHPRLIGADLYVARLGRRSGCQNSKRRQAPSCEVVSTGAPTCSVEIFTAGFATACATHQRSLHDELLYPGPRSVQARAPDPPDAFPAGAIHDSRPCYRCISYMHSIGIKRDFWTDSSGGWEGAKVRDLVDSLEASYEDLSSAGTSNGGRLNNGIFVTKHEVLMMRRIMGKPEPKPKSSSKTQQT